MEIPTGRSLVGLTQALRLKGENMTQERIYIVGSLDNNVRLVRATSRHQALSYVASTTYVVRVASQDELVKGLTSGVAVETARAAEQLQVDLGDFDA